MTSPVERACRALYKLQHMDLDPYGDGEEARWRDWEDEVKTVLGAIREPDSAMTRAAQSESHVAGSCEVDYHGIWASMIDTLLAVEV